ncbi:conserved membrane protein of unknown function [Nitrosopumilus piranensis]|uniref:Glycosyltransferase RgtA/B/C/D-like domain-containing protein n=2 Tax=Nitrosopumilus piranensis TaxID=1582439 RepID=A0A0C5C7T0_9ARCH|nr:conserved membrane protein of unknown function [Nitrosopumilus piranensis]
MIIQNNKIIIWTVFVFSISIVLISFVSVIFPALIPLSNTIDIPGIESVTPNPYEMGVWSGVIIISNIIIFGLLFLYFKNKLPKPISYELKRLFAFEISKKNTLIILIILFGIYISTSASEILQEEEYSDFIKIKEVLQYWSIERINSFEPHVNYFLLSTSMAIFGSYKVIPFFGSLGLLVTTFFITYTITQKRFAGIISTIILMQSNLFLTYDTSATYTNFWILFYLLSLFFVYRSWPLSPVSYLISIPSKILTIMFFPMSIYFILRSDISKNKKTIVISTILAVVIIGGIIGSGIGSAQRNEVTEEKFSSKEMLMGFSSFATQLRFDGLVLLFMIPLIVGLFIVSKNGIKHGESMMLLIAGLLLIAPIITGFTNQTNQPYRFVPLVVFFAIGVGVLLSKRQV